MRLQLALDMLSSESALAVSQAVEPYIDIIEIGTPLIKHEGISVLRLLRKHFPNKILLVDLKTMDVGQYEADFAFDAGADIVTVLGVADDATIAGAVASAEAHGKSVVVDIINVTNKPERARRIQDLGAHYIGVHSGIDQQKQGHSPLIDLRAVMNSVSIGVLVAGGIRLETLSEVLDMRPNIVVVGGAITSASDPSAVARSMKEQINLCRESYV